MTTLPPQAASLCCPILELRQYTLKPGQRDTLIDLFERYFIESQEAVGITVAGHFRDRDRADRFVWLRGFGDMERRRQALEAFYDGPIWARHRTTANGTMLDSDDVLLLRPARPGMDLSLPPVPMNPDPVRSATIVLAGIYRLPLPPGAAVVAEFERDIAPALEASGVRVQGVYVTEPSPNTFPRLPVREGDPVLAWFGTVDDQAPPRDWTRTLATLMLDGQPLSVLTLEPACRSALGHGPHAARASQHDFDFLFGRWTIRNRFLTKRLRGSSEWVEFDAQSEVQPLLNGFGHLDRYRAVRAGEPIEALTLRLFDPASGEWSIYWADTVRARTLLPPMVGRFTGGTGEFFGDESVDGKPVLCRFRWTRNSDSSPEWQQAFSDDGGKTWETNWVMTFTRR